MMFFRKSLFAVLAAAFAILLTGCNDKDNENKGVGAAAADQAAVSKYNAYVKAANSLAVSFNQVLQSHAQTYARALAGDKPLQNYSVASPIDVTKVKSALNEAFVKDATFADIDPAAKSYADALAGFEPINTDLANYAQSKGYLADGGKTAREKDPAFVDALKKVAAAEEAFFNSMQKHDYDLARKAYDEAAPDSVERDRAGIILFSKDTVSKLTAMFATPGDANLRDDTKASLNRLSDVSVAWDKKLRSSDAKGCPATMSAINTFIAGARTAVQRAEKGDYSVEIDPRYVNTIQDPVYTDGRQLNMNYSWLISSFNGNRC